MESKFLTGSFAKYCRSKSLKDNPSILLMMWGSNRPVKVSTESVNRRVLEKERVVELKRMKLKRMKLKGMKLKRVMKMTSSRK